MLLHTSFAHTIAVGTLLYFALTVTAKSTTNQLNLQQLQNIEQSLNHSVDPCDNFYEYACGNWHKHHSSGHTQEFITAADKLLRNKYHKRDNVRQHNQTFVDKALTLYDSCRHNSDADWLEVIKPGKDLEWPLVETLRNKGHAVQQSFSGFDFMELLSQMFSYGINNVVLRITLKRQTNGTLFVAVEAPAEDGEIEIFISTYTNRLPAKMGGQLKQELTESYEYWHSAFQNNSKNNYVSLPFAQVKVLHPQMVVFLQNMLPNQLRNDDMIFLAHPDYIRFVFDKQWTEAEAKKQANYLSLELQKYLAAQHTSDCESALPNFMQFAFNFMYYQHYILPDITEIRTAFNELRGKVYNGLLELLNENRLHLSTGQLEAFKAKLNKSVTSFGNLPEGVDFSMVDQFYRSLPDLDNQNYAKNELLLLHHRLLESINCPKGMKCADDFASTPINYAGEDLVVVPLASFTAPLYHWSYEPIFAASGLGFILGHELAHCIDTDDEALEYFFDEWSEDLLKNPHREESLQCMQQQDFTFYIYERVADLVGARVAYEVYTRHYHDQPNFSKIPWQQLFFLNLAQFECQSPGERAVGHDDGNVRLHEIAMNMPEFSQAYQCASGSKMNPVKKCRLY